MMPEMQPCRVLSSLYFHLQGISLRSMLKRYLHIRGLSRLMAGLFAMQIIVGGFCLLTAEAHAMPQAMQGMNMAGNCAKAMHGDVAAQHDAQGHSDACYHCDQPTELSNSNTVSLAEAALVLQAVVSLPAAPQYQLPGDGLFVTRMPTGPPGSASLLYQTSLRILI